MIEDCYYGDDYLKNVYSWTLKADQKSAKGDDLIEEFLKGKVIEWRMLHLCLTIAWRIFIMYVCSMDRRKLRGWFDRRIFKGEVYWLKNALFCLIIDRRVLLHLPAHGTEGGLILIWLKNNCKGAVWLWLKNFRKGANIKGAVWLWLKNICKGADIYWGMLICIFDYWLKNDTRGWS